MRVKPVSREISSLVFFLNLALRQNQNVTISELKETTLGQNCAQKWAKRSKNSVFCIF